MAFFFRTTSCSVVALTRPTQLVNSTRSPHHHHHHRNNKSVYPRLCGAALLAPVSQLANPTLAILLLAGQQQPSRQATHRTPYRRRPHTRTHHALTLPFRHRRPSYFFIFSPALFISCPSRSRAPIHPSIHFAWVCVPFFGHCRSHHLSHHTTRPRATPLSPPARAHARAHARVSTASSMSRTAYSSLPFSFPLLVRHAARPCATGRYVGDLRVGVFLSFFPSFLPSIPASSAAAPNVRWIRRPASPGVSQLQAGRSLIPVRLLLFKGTLSSSSRSSRVHLLGATKHALIACGWALAIVLRSTAAGCWSFCQLLGASCYHRAILSSGNPFVPAVVDATRLAAQG
ncbi:hypothetical protein BKA81DRAFT_427975 [Phyllosticta paracitricarpa]